MADRALDGRVALVSRSREELDAVAERIRADGGDARVATADVANAGAIRRAIDETARAWGRAVAVVG
jgi:NADP-dependent 3-hydroxy acid dehydrogenase YdfG